MEFNLDEEGQMGCEHQNHRPCKACIDEFIAPMARMSSLGHFFTAFVCLFNFEFYGILVELVWAVQRLFEIGDYGPEGWFKELGIDWKKPNE